MSNEEMFGASRGWKYRPMKFAVLELVRRSSRATEDTENFNYLSRNQQIFDHCSYFTKNGRPAAIVSQPYTAPELFPEHQKLLREHNLVLSKLGIESWHDPACMMYLIEPLIPEGTIISPTEWRAYQDSCMPGKTLRQKWRGQAGRVRKLFVEGYL